MKLKPHFCNWLAAVTVLSATVPALTALGDAWQRPAWLTEASLGVKESYDNNVFMSAASAANPAPPGSVAAVKNKASWLTTVSPKVDVNFAPLLGDLKTVQVLSLAYAPDLVTYHDQDSESYNAQRFSAALKARTDSVSVSADDTFLFVDGNEFSPVYPGQYSAFAASAARDRRRQIQNRANFTLQFDRGQWFFRPTATLLYYDFLTEKLNLTGYQNSADRYDVNGGGDVGYKVASPLAVTVGWRYGHQGQEQFAFSPYSSPNDYQRVLLGLEGRPWNWLDVKIQGGPDFRYFEGNTATHSTPRNDLNPVKYYGEALLTARLTAADTLTFKSKQWQWLSGAGKISYFISTCDLSYHRKLTDKLGFDLGGSLSSWDYSGGNISNCQRKDLQYTVTAGLGYAFNSHWSVNAGGAFDWGRSSSNPEGREFDHQLFSLGAQCKF